MLAGSIWAPEHYEFALAGRPDKLVNSGETRPMAHRDISQQHAAISHCGDLIKVDCAACHHAALLRPESLLQLGLSPQAKMLDLNHHLFEPKY